MRSPRDTTVGLIGFDERVVTKLGSEPAERETSDRSGSGLPLSLMRQASRRLQAVSLVLLVAVIISWFVVNLMEGQLALEFRTPAQWVPPVVMIVASILVLVITRSSLLSAPSVITMGLIYEVVVSCCMPLSEYWGAFEGLAGDRLTDDLVGLSPVGIWILFFTVLVPARPRSALIALVLSASAVPITIAGLVVVGNAPPIPGETFLFVFVLPYFICVTLAYVSARIIYGLGRSIGRAEDMGSYHLLDLLGRGGMGEVWRAQHNMLARPAAIKLIRREAFVGSPRALEALLARFEREAQVTAGLQSPHTVELYDFGISDEGTLYYVMELLEGVDLETLVRRFGPLPGERAVYILGQVCHSLNEAHRRGLVHRDIKPANIYLCQRALEHDFVKVLDFGLVKRLASIEPGSDWSMTQVKAVAGTPAYIAPEIALGQEAIDGRADIYSLGCVAFWLLTGRHVFEDKTPMAMIVAHTNATPDPPSSCIEAPIPADLDRLVLGCLAKDPAHRPESAEVLARALQELDLKTPWSRERASRWWQLHEPTRTDR